MAAGENQGVRVAQHGGPVHRKNGLNVAAFGVKHPPLCPVQTVTELRSWLLSVAELLARRIVTPHVIHEEKVDGVILQPSSNKQQNQVLLTLKTANFRSKRGTVAP